MDGILCFEVFDDTAGNCFYDWKWRTTVKQVQLLQAPKP